MPAVSVVVATRDRARFLQDALASLEDQSCDWAGYEVIVVDNGSTDDTRDVVRRSTSRYDNFRYLHVAPPGLSAARNAGIEEARGAVVAFLDDDSIASHGWVEAMAAAFERDPKLGAVGGPIELVWPDGPPRWLSGNTAVLYAALDHGPEPRELSFPLSPFGANFGARAEALTTVGGFSTRIGRVGGGLVSGDEAELCLRIARAGYRVMYDPSLPIEHQVQPVRVSARWVLHRAFDQGRTRAIASGLAGIRTSRADWLRLMVLSFLQTIAAAMRGLLALVTFRPRPVVMDAAVQGTLTFGCTLQSGRQMLDPGRYAPEP